LFRMPAFRLTADQYHEKFHIIILLKFSCKLVA
jgi:hypothetical protein